MKNDFLRFSGFTALLISIRVLLNNSKYLVFIVSFINLIVLLLVCISINSQLKTKLFNIIDRSGVPREVVEREKKSIQKSVNCSIYIPFLLISVIYLGFFSSQLGNDIIAIIALGLSLCDNDLVDMASKLYKY